MGNKQTVIIKRDMTDVISQLGDLTLDHLFSEGGFSFQAVPEGTRITYTGSDAGREFRMLVDRLGKPPA